VPRLKTSMPRELAQLREPVGRVFVEVIWLMTPLVIGLACLTRSNWEWAGGFGLAFAGMASIAWWMAGSARLARLLVAASLAGQVSLLMVVGSGTSLEGEMPMLPFATLAALVAYGDRGAVVTSGIILAAIHVTGWTTAMPASGMLLYLSIMALQIVGVGWLARKLRGFAVRAAHARHAAASAQMTFVTPGPVLDETGRRFELTLPAFAPSFRRGGDHGRNLPMLQAGRS
jgi:hypothetical protein